jgi:hypothetical protein
MFWELSGDQNCDLIGATFDALNNGLRPASESKPPIEFIPSIVRTKLFTPPITKFPSTKIITNEYHVWETYKDYKFGDQVAYESKIYKCIAAHTSLPGWTPYTVGALWRPI